MLSAKTTENLYSFSIIMFAHRTKQDHSDLDVDVNIVFCPARFLAARKCIIIVDRRWADETSPPLDRGRSSSGFSARTRDVPSAVRHCTDHPTKLANTILLIPDSPSVGVYAYPPPTGR